MRKLRVKKNPEKLSCQSKTVFLGNKNEILYYTDWTTGKNYARAKFDYSEDWNRYLYDEWFLLSKEDIKDDDALSQTEIKINAYFGYFASKRKIW